MKCFICSRDIGRGDMPKRVEYHRAPDKSLRIYGVNMPDGLLDKAAGPLVKAAHSKCYWVITKRVRRGGGEVGGTHPGLVDAYDEDDAEDQPARIRQARQADPGYREREDSDWRPQTIGEV